MKLAIGADPFAYGLKKAVAQHLKNRGVEVMDMDSYAETPYNEVAEKAAREISAGNADGAVLFCGTGAGMAIVANKICGVRAVCVESVFAAKKAKAINDANAITMGAMIIGEAMACEMVDACSIQSLRRALSSCANFSNRRADRSEKLTLPTGRIRKK